MFGGDVQEGGRREGLLRGFVFLGRSSDDSDCLFLAFGVAGWWGRLLLVLLGVFFSDGAAGIVLARFCLSTVCFLGGAGLEVLLLGLGTFLVVASAQDKVDVLVVTNFVGTETLEVLKVNGLKELFQSHSFPLNFGEELLSVRARLG